VFDRDHVTAIAAKHLFGGGVRGEPSRAGAVVHLRGAGDCFCWASRSAPPARGSLLVVIGFRPTRRARDAIAEILFLASSLRDDEWVYEATATAPSVAAREPGFLFRPSDVPGWGR
jgi:hypothetical protein